MRLTQIAGIPIRLHWSFLLIVGLVAFYTLSAEGVMGLVTTVILGVGLFTSVVLHELGHALAARVFGIRTAHITLYPFGGIAAIRQMPANPAQEMVIALAGPMVNFVLFTGLIVLGFALGSTTVLVLAGLNLVMGVFNLIPAFPMDGGRVLRALLTLPLGWWRASRVALAIGSVFAWIFIGVGLLTGVWSLALVGGFLVFATWMERRRLELLKQWQTYPQPPMQLYSRRRTTRRQGRW